MLGIEPKRLQGRFIDEHGRVCCPTHWMPLPERPTDTSTVATQGAK
jgi:hypothetical protein